MNITTLERSLICADNIIEHIPGLSMIAAVAAIAQKAIFQCFDPPENNYYFTYIKEKSLFRCLLLFIPIIGNLSILCLNPPSIPEIPRIEESEESSSERAERPYDEYIEEVTGKELTKIPITFAYLNDLELHSDNLSEIFRRINNSTLNKPYPNEQVKTDGIPRANHNGTHGARKARMFRIIASWFLDDSNHGTTKTMEDLDFQKTDSNGEKIDYTYDMIDFLTLGIYLMRSGRLDESNFRSENYDANYKIRSARIFAEYAQNFPEFNEYIPWVESLISNSCIPTDKLDEGFFVKEEEQTDLTKRNETFYHLFSLVHKLDLIRCYRPNQELGLYQAINEHLSYLLYGNKELTEKEEKNVKDKVATLLSISRSLCRATGSRIRATSNEEGDYAKFSRCSSDGKYCWESLKKSAVKSKYLKLFTISKRA